MHRYYQDLRGKICAQLSLEQAKELSFYFQQTFFRTCFFVAQTQISSEIYIGNLYSDNSDNNNNDNLYSIHSSSILLKIAINSIENMTSAAVQLENGNTFMSHSNKKTNLKAKSNGIKKVSEKHFHSDGRKGQS